jgi:hypothetical protein
MMDSQNATTTEATVLWSSTGDSGSIPPPTVSPRKLKWRSVIDLVSLMLHAPRERQRLRIAEGDTRG